MDKKKALVGAFFAFLMVFSVFGFVLSYNSGPTHNTLEYFDYSFTIRNNHFYTEVDGEERAFLFFPGDLEYVEISEEARTMLEAPVLTVTYDPAIDVADQMGEAQYYMEVHLQESKVIERALTTNATALPVKTCEDGTEAQPVIEFRVQNESGIFTENSCIIVSAVDSYDLFQQTQRIIYHVLGIMQ